MTDAHFSSQLNRLAETFGKGAYGNERAKLLWREVKDFSNEWMTRTVDELIGSCRHAPLVGEFREYISRERERSWSREKREHAEDAKDFMSGIFQPEDTRTICQYIVKRLAGGVSDQDFESFVKHLKDAAIPQGPKGTL